jgi:hypothetical protein
MSVIFVTTVVAVVCLGLLAAYVATEVVTA